jgi:GH25 family lysozyme M1 (1,4-beta-N-acetylmuramidase)
MPRDPRFTARPLAALLLAALAATLVLPASGLAATNTDYLANCPVNLRTTTSTSGAVADVIATGSLVTASGSVAGGAWSATCVNDVSGSTWYSIIAVGGRSVSSLYGVSVVYAATGLFHVAPPPGSYLEGIDVSHWQGSINWSSVAAAGKKFAILKATQAQIYADATYASHHAAARSVGIRVGAYHYADPASTANDAVLQADWFVNHANLLAGDVVPALDLEETGGLSVSALQTWVGSFLARVYATTGARPMIYTSPSFWKTYMGDTRTFADAGYTVLWVAHWFTAAPTVPASSWGGRGWTFWQYSDCGSVPGIGGCVDLDRFNGLDLTKVTYKANFALSAPASLALKQGASATATVALNRTYFGLPIALSVTGAPAGASVTISPSSAGGSSATLSLKTSKSGTITPVGSYPLTISGVSNGLTRTAKVTLGVTDGIAPAVSSPVSRLVYTSTLGSSSVPVRTSWLASDPSGIGGYTLKRSLNDAAWVDQANDPATSSTVSQSLTFGTRYRYVVKATDGNGNTGLWAYGPRFTPLLTQQNGSGVSSVGSWTSVSLTSASGGSLKYTATKGASATYLFTGSSVAWVAYRGPNRGSAAVYVDGVYRTTINLYSAAYKAKVIAYAFSWGGNGTHTIKIVCLGTTGHARVDVDAFVRIVQG